MDDSRFEQKLMRVEGWLELRAYDEARDEALRLIAAGRWEVHYLMGRIAMEQGEFGAAVVHYETALGHGPLDPSAIWLDLGWCHKRTGRLDLAIDDMERLLRQDETSAIGHYNLACYLALHGDAGRSLGYLAHALAIDPDFAAEVEGESDFDSLRALPAFRELVASVQAQQGGASSGS